MEFEEYFRTPRPKSPPIDRCTASMKPGQLPYKSRQFEVFGAGIFNIFPRDSHGLLRSGENTGAGFACRCTKANESRPKCGGNFQIRPAPPHASLPSSLVAAATRGEREGRPRSRQLATPTTGADGRAEEPAKGNPQCDMSGAKEATIPGVAKADPLPSATQASNSSLRLLLTLPPTPRPHNLTQGHLAKCPSVVYSPPGQSPGVFSS